jgi:hypothetical protein
MERRRLDLASYCGLLWWNEWSQGKANSLKGRQEMPAEELNVAWLQYQSQYADYYKFLIAGRILGIDRDTVAGKVIRLWIWSLEASNNGELPVLPDYALHDIMKWGDTIPVEKAINALKEAGLLEPTPGGSYYLPEWAEYGAPLQSARTAKKEYMRRKRASATTVQDSPLDDLFAEEPVPDPPKKSKSAPKEYADDSDAIYLATLLRQGIVRNNPKSIAGRMSDADMQRWAKDIDLMIRRDGREVDDIQNVIEWSQQDDFWQQNILSPAKLREHFDKLYTKLNSAGFRPGYSSPSPAKEPDCIYTPEELDAWRNGPSWAEMCAAEEAKKKLEAENASV